jgi:aldose 1-epimerase
MISLVAGDAQATIAPECGGRIASLVFGGHELLLQEPEAAQRLGVDPAPPTRWGMFLMAPWAGRVRHGRFRFEGVDHQLPINKAPNAIHGTIFDRPADIVDSDATSATLSWRLAPPWPFAGVVTSHVELTPDALHLRLEVAAEQAMPVTLGWHPWWKTDIGTGRPLVIDAALVAMYQQDDEAIPTGQLVAPGAQPWDDCFVAPQGPIRLRWPNAVTLRLETECPDVVVFTQIPFGHCVEPQSGPPDALNSGTHLQVLAPGQRASASCRWVHEPSPDPAPS